MFDQNYQGPLNRLKEFLQLYSEELQNASLLLGGKPALKAAADLLDDVREADRPTRRLKAGLVRLYELLSLQHVHDPDRPEAAYFADLDPAAHYVEDICLLAEALLDVLYEINEHAGRPFLPLLAAA
ncbi:hypothetical protein [Celeribacter sp. PS-C1]|uniref:hypothetical protein n=1 Tax=Celeribacter sp. PS-C1 TaxID=2820813 RepID=UPI001CA48E58|nr:hypothetical protein [Celeribacter sp. PS-C1]MBW6419804.1 hypothetical protein [Celeribacter sp. PS-C1]